MEDSQLVLLLSAEQKTFRIASVFWPSLLTEKIALECVILLWKRKHDHQHLVTCILSFKKVEARLDSLINLFGQN